MKNKVNKLRGNRKSQPVGKKTKKKKKRYLIENFKTISQMIDAKRERKRREKKKKRRKREGKEKREKREKRKEKSSRE